MEKYFKVLEKNQGFTVVELMFSIATFLIVVTGFMQMFIQTSVLAELSGNQTLYISKAQDKLEEIRNSDYNNIVEDYNENSFFILESGKIVNVVSIGDEIMGAGIIYAQDFANTDEKLLKIKVVISWKNKYGRVVGEDGGNSEREDQKLNGILDAGEDIDGNGKLDSPVTLVTLVAKK